MQHAVREAGIAMPHNKRIWLWLKDKAPTPQTAAAIAAALKIKPNHVAAMCVDLEARGMVVRTMDRVRLPGKGGTLVDREVSFFTIASRVGEHYELLPKPHKAAPTRPPAPTAPVPQHAPPPAVPQEFSPENFVAKLSLKQCKELFNYLNGIFNAKE